MDLRNNQITVRELLADPKARQVLARQFPQVINRPIVAKSGSMTLDKAMKLGAAYVPKFRRPWRSSGGCNRNGPGKPGPYIDSCPGETGRSRRYHSRQSVLPVRWRRKRERRPSAANRRKRI